MGIHTVRREHRAGQRGVGGVAVWMLFWNAMAVLAIAEWGRARR
jgi:hypothetical protein